MRKQHNQPDSMSPQKQQTINWTTTTQMLPCAKIRAINQQWYQWCSMKKRCFANSHGCSGICYLAKKTSNKINLVVAVFRCKKNNQPAMVVVALRETQKKTWWQWQCVWQW